LASIAGRSEFSCDLCLTLHLLEAPPLVELAPVRGKIDLDQGRSRTMSLCEQHWKAKRMTSMASLARVWRIVWTALLALAVASAWSSGSMAGGPLATHVHAHADVQTNHAHVPTASAQSDLSSSHDPAGVACCVMTICHPAIPVLAVEVGSAASNGLPEPVPFLCSDGKEPSPALPPPRNSQV
jgi:hypothetical protein